MSFCVGGQVARMTGALRAIRHNCMNEPRVRMFVRLAPGRANELARLSLIKFCHEPCVRLVTVRPLWEVLQLV